MLREDDVGGGGARRADLLLSPFPTPRSGDSRPANPRGKSRHARRSRGPRVRHRGVSVVRKGTVRGDSIPPQKRQRAPVVRQQNISAPSFAALIPSRPAPAPSSTTRLPRTRFPPSRCSSCARQNALSHTIPPQLSCSGLILLHHQLVVSPDRVPHHVSVGEVEEPLGDRAGLRAGLPARIPGARPCDRIRDHRLVVRAHGRRAAHGLMPAREANAEKVRDDRQCARSFFSRLSTSRVEGFKNSRASVIATARRPNAARADFRLVPRGRAETRASWTTTSPRG